MIQHRALTCAGGLIAVVLLGASASAAASSLRIRESPLVTTAVRVISVGSEPTLDEHPGVAPPIRVTSPPPPPPSLPDPGPSPAVAVWPPQGVVICDAPGLQQSLQATDDFAHGAYFAWADDRRSGGRDIYAIRIDASGVPAAGWPSNGMAVSSLTGISDGPRIVAHDATGVWVTWQSQSAVYAQRLTPGGQPAPGWPAGGRRICESPVSAGSYQVFDDLQGGIVVAWQERTATRDKWHVQHVDPNGSSHAGWPDCGLQFFGSGSCQSSVGYELLGMHFGWPDGLFVKIRTFDCTNGASFMNAFEVTPSVVTSAYPDVCPREITQTEGSGARFTVDQCGVLTRTGDTYAPSWSLPGFSFSELPVPDGFGRFSLLVSGRLKVIENLGTWSTAFGATAPLLCGPTCQPVSILRVSDGSGGFFVAWDDPRPGAPGLYGTWFRSDGTRGPGWAEDGSPLTTVPMSTSLAALVGDRRGNAIAAWTDERNGNLDFFAQRLVGNPLPAALKKPNTLPEALVPSSHVDHLTLSGARPNPSDEGLRVEFSLARAGDASLRVLDVAGRVVATSRTIGLAAGTHSLAIARPGELPPGIYLIELSAEGRVLRSKAVVTR